MFNAEKLLGKLLQGAMSGKKTENSLLNNLASGGGLMTAIGLGVGAFEILTEKQSQAENNSPLSNQPPPVSPAPQTPPPIPSATATPPPLPTQKLQSTLNESELAVRMIQAMIAAAHADGILEEEEQQKIVTKLQETELSDAEKQFLLAELAHPKTIDELTTGITGSAIAQTMYSLALSSITVDTEKERIWCDALATGLSLDKSVQNMIEEALNAGKFPNPPLVG